MVRHSSGAMPASYAATRARSISRGRGSGSASAVTTTSWSALATTTRSTGSSSSAVRRSTVVRSLTSTIRARPLGAGHVADDPHPVADHDALAAQRPGLHRDHRSSSSTSSVNRPRSTVTHDAVDRVVVGRPLLGARAGAPARPLVVLDVLVGVAPGRPAHSSADQTSAKSGKVLPVVATFSTRTPSTAAPTTTPACAIRWSA